MSMMVNLFLEINHSNKLYTGIAGLPRRTSELLSFSNVLDGMQVA